MDDSDYGDDLDDVDEQEFKNPIEVELPDKDCTSKRSIGIFLVCGICSTLLVVVIFISVGLLDSEKVVEEIGETLSDQSIRTYYIAAEETIWDYAPHGNQLTGGELPRNPSQLGYELEKLRFVEYDEHFSHSVKKSSQWEHTGLLGPVIEARVGDKIEVVFKNKALRPFSLHAQGLRYTKESEGTRYLDDALFCEDNSFYKNLCPFWAEEGECTENKDFMLSACQLSCGECEECLDTPEECANVLAADCELDSSTVKTCPQSCGRCGSPYDDDVLPGDTYKYIWTVPKSAGPAEGALSRIWAYHSNVNTLRDISSGLVGPIIVYPSNAIFSDNGYLIDPDTDNIRKQFILDIAETNEDNSWMFQPNLKFAHLAQSQGNIVNSINGFTYGNLDGNFLFFNQGEKVTFHLMTLSDGTSHAIEFEGAQIATSDNEYVSSVSLNAGSFQTIEISSQIAGTWEISSLSGEQRDRGMGAQFLVMDGDATPSADQVIHDKYIAIVDQEWDYGPLNTNMITGKPFADDSLASLYTNKYIGKIYTKARYVEYEDKDFSRLSDPSPEWQHLGLLGPVIEAEVGDIINVTVRNMAKRTYSIYPQTLAARHSEPIPPDETVAFEWTVTDRSGPAQTQDNTMCMYYSNYDQVSDIASGLMGPIIIYRKGEMQQHKTDGVTDRILMMSTIDENLSHYIEDNSMGLEIDQSNNQEYLESNRMHCVNGRVFGNLNLTFSEDIQKVRWHLTSLGSSESPSSIIFEGHTVTFLGTTSAATSLGASGTSLSVQMSPLHEGNNWIIHNGNVDLFQKGMSALFSVHGPNRQEQEQEHGEGEVFPGIDEEPDVEIFIAIHEVSWDYFPDSSSLTGVDIIHQTTEKAPTRIGSEYRKLLFQEYTDQTFSELEKRDDHWEHLGFLGPLIVASPGQSIRAHLKNEGSQNHTLSPIGLLSSKPQLSESAVVTPPGETNTYNWKVPDDVEMDSDATLFLYTSNVDLKRDVNSGLVGPILIKNPAPPDEEPKDLILYLSIIDEANSWLFEENLHRHVNPEYITDSLLNSRDFQESNKMASLNGLMFGNLNEKLLHFSQKDAVRWHFAAGINDHFSVTFHGNNLRNSPCSTDENVRLAAYVDSVPLAPLTTRTMDMCGFDVQLSEGVRERNVVGLNDGIWMIRSSVLDHASRGVVATYEVIGLD